METMSLPVNKCLIASTRLEEADPKNSEACQTARRVDAETYRSIAIALLDRVSVFVQIMIINYDGAQSSSSLLHHVGASWVRNLVEAHVPKESDNPS